MKDVIVTVTNIEELGKAIEGKDVTEINLKFDEEIKKDPEKRKIELFRLIMILASNPSVTTLNVPGNQLDADNAKLILGALTNIQHIKKLDISHNRIGDKGAEFILLALEENTCLRTVILEGNGITDQLVLPTQEEEEKRIRNAKIIYKSAENVRQHLEAVETEKEKDKYDTDSDEESNKKTLKKRLLSSSFKSSNNLRKNA